MVQWRGTEGRPKGPRPAMWDDDRINTKEGQMWRGMQLHRNLNACALVWLHGGTGG